MVYHDDFSWKIFGTTLKDIRMTVIDLIAKIVLETSACLQELANLT